MKVFLFNFEVKDKSYISLLGVQSFGVVKGISVRTRNVCADFLIALNALIGGTNYLVRELYYDTRQEV
jgi:uncharacterized protein YbjQ (UPF0145 family)